MPARHTPSRLLALAVATLCLWPTAAQSTPLSPFIDLQEKGLTLAGDGVGLIALGPGTATLTVDIGGTVRFALLYWAGRQRPCEESPPGSGNCVVPAQPYRDQQIVFDGTPLTGTIIGSEGQPVSGGGPILNIGYFADVTSIVAAKGAGLHSFGFADGNTANNLWRLDGAALLVAFTDPAATSVFRVLVHDGLDFAFGPDPTPGDPRVTAPATLDHGANLVLRAAELWLAAGDGVADRPDRIDISNNASVAGALDAGDGGQWDLERLPIDIPAGVGSTTVQLFSEPVDQFPDSLLWEMAALRVEQLDAQGPTCPITLFDSGPPARLEITVRDTGTGLAEILVTKSQNADTVVPPFTVGTFDPVVVTATKIDQSKGARVELRVTDLAGNVVLCDPILTSETRATGKPFTHTFSEVPAAERFVTVTNGTPGLTNLRVVVNGTIYQMAGLEDGEVRTLDVGAAMLAGDANVVSLTALGKPGGSASILIWDGVSD